jgi:hypothetical protein
VHFDEGPALRQKVLSICISNISNSLKWFFQPKTIPNLNLLNVDDFSLYFEVEEDIEGMFQQQLATTITTKLD